MQLVWPDQLLPGMRLASDVYKGSVLFLPRSVPITDRVIAQLLSTGYDQKVPVDNGTPCPIRRSKRGYELEMVESEHGLLQLTGNVFVESFVQSESRLYCEGNLEIAGDVKPFATVACTGTLTIRGAICGAVAIAGEALKVAVAGNANLSAPTLLSCYDFLLMERGDLIDDLEREHQAVHANMVKLTPAINAYSQKQKAGLLTGIHEKAQVRKLLETYSTFQRQVERIRARVQETREIQRKPTILIQKALHSNVSCQIDDIFCDAMPCDGPIAYAIEDGALAARRCTL